MTPQAVLSLVPATTWFALRYFCRPGVVGGRSVAERLVDAHARGCVDGPLPVVAHNGEAGQVLPGHGAGANRAHDLDLCPGRAGDGGCVGPLWHGRKRAPELLHGRFPPRRRFPPPRAPAAPRAGRVGVSIPRTRRVPPGGRWAALWGGRGRRWQFRRPW